MGSPAWVQISQLSTFSPLNPSYMPTWNDTHCPRRHIFNTTLAAQSKKYSSPAASHQSICKPREATKSMIGLDATRISSANVIPDSSPRWMNNNMSKKQLTNRYLRVLTLRLLWTWQTSPRGNSERHRQVLSPNPVVPNRMWFVEHSIRIHVWHC